MKNFDSLFASVKEYSIDWWEARKVKLYGEPSFTQLQSQSLAGRDGAVDWGREGVSLVSSVSQGDRVMGKLFMNKNLLCISSCKAIWQLSLNYTGQNLNEELKHFGSYRMQLPSSVKVKYKQTMAI